MLNLKAELLKKRQEFEKEKTKTDKTYITSKEKTGWPIIKSISYKVKCKLE